VDRVSTAPPATVRPATPDDARALVAIDLVNTTPSTSPGPPPAADADPFARRPPADVLVAEVDGHVVGYVNLGHPTPLASNAHVWEVQGLSVLPSHGRRGLGRALLRAAVAEATRRGGRRMTLRVFAPNAHARRLYESEGFEVEGVLRGEFVLDGVEVDDVLMARRLA
jgi:ribosomal protein S18 acetylase RimI-like enzyme